MTEIGLLAAPATGQDRLESIFRHFQSLPRSSPNEFWPAVLLLIAGLALIGLLIRWVLAWPGKKNRPWGLFFTLCRRHRLSWRERWMLWQLARNCSPEMPARVFLDPELFPTAPFPGQGSEKAALLANLRVKLFGELPPTKKTFAGQEQQTPSESENRAHPGTARGVGFPRALAPSLEWPGWGTAPVVCAPKSSEGEHGPTESR